MTKRIILQVPDTSLKKRRELREDDEWELTWRRSGGGGGGKGVITEKCSAKKVN